MIDIHTHTERGDRPGVVQVRNVRLQDIGNLNFGDGLYSVGFHPWDSGTVNFDLDRMNQAAAHPHVIAIGECGIDRLRGAGQDLQSALFREQALIGEIHEKPLVIHCVGAWQEIIAIKKTIRPDVPWIIHGFRGKPELAAQLTSQGFYLSFGESIINPADSVGSSFISTHNGRIFLETDESPHPIEDIYFAAADIKRLSLNDLQRVIDQNFEKVFGIHGTSRMAAKD
jgi:TatD DNase family protein